MLLQPLFSKILFDDVFPLCFQSEMNGNLPIFIDFFVKKKKSTVCDIISRTQERNVSTKRLVSYLVTVLAVIHCDTLWYYQAWPQTVLANLP